MDTVPTEFPRVNDTLIGTQMRYGYTVRLPHNTAVTGALIRSSSTFLLQVFHKHTNVVQEVTVVRVFSRPPNNR